MITVNLTDYSFHITILNLRIILKDDIEFVTEFPCLLGHTVAGESINFSNLFGSDSVLIQYYFGTFLIY